MRTQRSTEMKSSSIAPIQYSTKRKGGENWKCYSKQIEDRFGIIQARLLRLLPVTKLLEMALFRFDYDDSDGVLRHKNHRNKECNGLPAGSVHEGYLRVTLWKTRFWAHRIIWLMHYGRWPVGQIDHIDGDRSNNRLSNLREVTQQQNNCNRPNRSKSQTGVKNVKFEYNGYKVSVILNGKSHYGGRFKTLEEAAIRADQLRREVHGDFSRKDHLAAIEALTGKGGEIP